MLQEEQLTIGPQHPHDLLQGQFGSVDGAQHEGRDDGVDRSVGERQPLGWRVDQPCAPARIAQALLEPGTHWEVWFDEDQLDELIGVVRQVETSAAAYLDREPTRPAEKVLSERAHSRPLADPQERVIDHRKSTSPDRRTL